MGQYKVLISFLNNQTRVYTCRVKSTILVPLDLSGFRGGLYCTSDGACCSSTVQLTISHCYSWGGGVSSLLNQEICVSQNKLFVIMIKLGTVVSPITPLGGGGRIGCIRKTAFVSECFVVLSVMYLQ